MMKPISIYLFSVCLMMFGTLSAQTQAATDSVAHSTQSSGVVVETSKTLADEAYAAGNFQRAITLYEQILTNQGEASDIYYNLGNSYYKGEQIAKAILNYERALQLAPGDDDIRFNLDLARSKTVDKITPLSEVFFITWARDFANLLSSDAWAKWGIAFFLLFIVAVSVYIFGHKIAVRKASFFLALLFLAVCIAANVSANYQKGERLNHTEAIVMLPTVSVKSTPDKSGTDLFVLHEGCKVKIKDNTMSNWKEIRLPDGNVGWLPAESIEAI